MDEKKFKEVELLHVMFSSHSVKFQIIKRFFKITNTWKLTNIQLDNLWIKESELKLQTN